MRNVHFGVVLLGVLLALSGVAVIAAPTARAAPTRAFVLHGDAVGGWGLTNTTIASPGPTLVVNAGDSVSLELLSNDSAAHTWFIDYNNNSATDSGEPSSAQFSSRTVAIWYNFTADAGHVGTWTYRCAIHPNVMKGLIVILAAPTFVLYGSATSGWGASPTTITNPGPSLAVDAGQSVTFELVSQDGQTHSFFIDLNGNGIADANEPQSPQFGGSGHPSVIDWSWTASLAPGNYTYSCAIHTTAMKGTLTVASTTPPSTPPDYTIYAAIIVAVAIVAIVVVVAIRRKPRTPPREPPTRPEKPS